MHRFGRSSSSFQTRGRRLVAALLVLLATAFEAASAPSAASATTRRELRGERVAIHNLVGTLLVTRGEGSSVVAEITTSGEDAAKLRLGEGFVRGKTTLRIIYPSNRIHVARYGRFSTSNFWVREDGTLDGKSGEGHKVTLSGRDGLDASADVKLFVPRGAKVDVYWGHGSGSVRDLDADLSIDGAALSVSAAGVSGSFRVSVGSGSVEVRRSDGAIAVETGSGDVELSDVKGAGLTAETGSGTIRATDLDCSAIGLETGSGNIEARAVRASRASLETGSGTVEAILDSDVQHLSIESGSGDVRLAVPRSFGATVHLETGSGRIDAGVPIEIRSKSRNELTGTIGDGRGRLSLETGSGSIVLRSSTR